MVRALVGSLNSYYKFVSRVLSAIIKRTLARWLNMESSSTSKIKHGRGPHGASHPPWVFRRESAIWCENEPIASNMAPLASEMFEWLSQTRRYMAICTESARGQPRSFTNPYTYFASTIAAVIGAAINAAHQFVTSTDQVDPLDAEITRIRLQNELILYSARFCESAIKQMLFCTQIPRRLYKNASLGKLLAIDCEACRKEKKKPHDISLLGALAHQYFLCPVFEGCAFQHLEMVGSRRNSEAAHSDVRVINPRTVAESRSDLHRILDEVAHEFRHMVEHIGQIEQKMLAEINLYIEHRPNLPPVDALMKIPARPPEARIDSLGPSPNQALS